MTTGQAGYKQNQYSTGQMLIDPSRSFVSPSLDTSVSSSPTTSTNPSCPSISMNPYQPQLRDGPVARLEQPILVPGASNEVTGQVDQVVFSEGLVQYKGQWWLYYGQGDSELGVATAPVQ